MIAASGLPTARPVAVGATPSRVAGVSLGAGLLLATGGAGPRLTPEVKMVVVVAALLVAVVVQLHVRGGCGPYSCG